MPKFKSVAMAIYHVFKRLDDLLNLTEETSVLKLTGATEKEVAAHRAFLEQIAGESASIEIMYNDKLQRVYFHQRCVGAYAKCAAPGGLTSTCDG